MSTLVLVLPATLACGDTDKDAPAGSPTANGPKEPAKPAIECLDLPGAARDGLQLGPDGTSIYWRERASADEDAGWSLQTVAIAGGQPKRIADNVADQYRVLADGRVVFVRQGEKHEYMPVRFGLVTITTADGATVQLNGNDEQIRSLDVSPDGKWILYTRATDFEFELAKVGTAAGDKPAKLADGYSIESWNDKGEAIVFAGNGALVAVDVAAGTTRPLGDVIGKLVGVTGEQALTLIQTSMMNQTLGVAEPADAGAKTDLLGEVPGLLGWERHADGLVLSGRSGDAWVLKRYQAGAVTELARSTTVRIEDAVVAGPTMVVLARLDTDGDGAFTSADEADLCRIAAPTAPASPPTEIAPPLRTVPKTWLPKLEALRALATGELDDARVRIVDAKPAEIGFDVPRPATDIEALRTIVRDLGPKVAAASGDDRATTEIAFSDGKVAALRWHADVGKAFTEAGIGVAVVSNPAEYDVEVDPKITMYRENRGYGTSDNVGEAVCSGTVINRSAAPIEGLEIVCINTPRFDSEMFRPVTGAVKPKSLAPGKSGTYKVKLPVAVFDDPFETQLRLGGTPIAYYNAYAEKVSRDVLPVAIQLQASADLVYMGRRTGERTSYPRDEYTYVVLRGGKGFAEASASEQRDRVAAALVQLAVPLANATLADATIIGPTGWTIVSRYESGRLEPVD